MSWQHHGPDLVGPEAVGTVTLASDADRDAAVRVLSEAFAEGRLTADQHGERVRAAYAGRSCQELAWLTADLPGPAAAPGKAATTGRAAAGVTGGVDRCLLCALLIVCPPAGIAWLLAARYRWRAGQRHAVAAAYGSASVSTSGSLVPGGSAVRPGGRRRAEDR